MRLRIRAETCTVWVSTLRSKSLSKIDSSRKVMQILECFHYFPFKLEMLYFILLASIFSTEFKRDAKDHGWVQNKSFQTLKIFKNASINSTFDGLWQTGQLVSSYFHVFRHNFRNFRDNPDNLGKLSDEIFIHGDFGHLEKLWDVFGPLDGKVACYEVLKFAVCLDFFEALA